jgi:Ser/Thr protein kinase RdoA (MazF antagonist)
MNESKDGIRNAMLLLEHAHKIVPTWSIDPTTPIELLNISENTTFGVGSDHILRIHRAGYSSFEEIESELVWLSAVRNETGISTPVVVQSVNAQPIIRTRIDSIDSDRYAVMFCRLPGAEPTKESLSDLFEPLGAITARLHRHSQRWVRQRGFVRRLWDLDHSIGEQGHWGQWRHGLGVGESEREILGRLADRISTRLRAYGNDPARFGLIHADLRLANLLVDTNGEISVIDFDDSGFSWFGYDLGASLSFIEDHPQRGELIDLWCRGYRSVAPLDPETVDELMTFVMLRRLVLTAWFGTHSDIELAHGIGKTFAAGTCELAEQYLLTGRL